MFEIAQTSTGRLWIMPCPPAEGLGAMAQHYRQQGADHVVSMITSDEAALLGLSEEAAACAEVGVDFTQAPIPDFGLPDRAAFIALVTRIKGMLDAGQGVAVHCRAGIGRSGMVTSGVLIAQGLGADAAMAQVAHARGVSIPDTVEQATFVQGFTVGDFGENPATL